MLPPPFVLTGGLPPRIISKSIRHSAVVGEETLLKCPVEVEPQQSFYEWQKDNEMFDEYYDDQSYKLTRKGVLKIKSTSKQDEGDWLCRVTNGFGSVEAMVLLDVIEEKEHHTKINAQTGNHYPENDILGNRASKPKWTKLTKHNSAVKPHGSTFHITCKATGNPRPKIKWQKNGQHLEHENSRIKIIHYILTIDDLRETDSGNYTCTVFNTHGSLNSTYMLEVVGLVSEKPEILDNHPMNATLLFNETVALQCRVKSKVAPIIKWLKQLSEEEKAKMPEKQKVKVHNEFYKVLKSFQAIQQTDGSYLNKLVIKNANLTHSGKYICWAANALGYSFRSSFVNVVHNDKLMFQGSQSRLSYTETVLIGVVSGVVILSISLAAILAYLHYHRRTVNNRAQYIKAKS